MEGGGPLSSTCYMSGPLLHVFTCLLFEALPSKKGGALTPILEL